MKILILANDLGGLYLFRKELICELLKRGIEIIISAPNGKLVSFFVDIGCTFIDTPIDRRGINPKTDLALLHKYLKMIKKSNPDLVLTYTVKPNIYGGIAARRAKKQYAVNITGLGTAFEKTGPLRMLVVYLYKIALKKAKVVFFENSSNRVKITSLGCCSMEKTAVLNGAGVNTVFFDYQPYPHNDKFIFLFIGRVMKEKGIEELLESMAKLIKEGQRCFLNVVGPLEEDYTGKLNQCEKEGWLKYYGAQSDVRPFIKDCDCFVLPSWHEGMANTNLECASSGRPIITSNIPGCREAIAGGSGFLCEPRNINSLYETMKKMIELSRKDRETMGEIGRRHMENMFDKRKVVAETIAQLLN